MQTKKKVVRIRYSLNASGGFMAYWKIGKIEYSERFWSHKDLENYMLDKYCCKPIYRTISNF